MAVAAWTGRCSGAKARKLLRVRCRQKGRALAPGIDQEVQQRDEQMAVGLLHGRTSQREFTAARYRWFGSVVTQCKSSP